MSLDNVLLILKGWLWRWGAGCRVRYAKSVLKFMRAEIQTRKAYDLVDLYRAILVAFSKVGAGCMARTMRQHAR